MHRYLIFVQKEFLHILRDKRTILILLLLPVVQIVLFGFALSTEVKNSNITLVDFAKDNLSAELIQKFSTGEYFTPTCVNSQAEAEHRLREGKTDIVLIIGKELKKNVVTGNPEAALQLIADASDPNKARLVSGYATAIIASSEILRHLPASRNPGAKLNVSTQMLYNPAMKGAYNFVPGVMGLVLMIICAMMTSLSIVKEKESGSMDLILVSPASPLAVITSKMLPYLALSLINLTTILLLSTFVLDVPIRGSLFLLLLLSTLFIVVSLALGLLISTLVKTQMAALIGSGMVLMMPTMILSGMMFPVESMPVLLQGMSMILPARWYIDGVREVMIQGLGFSSILRELAVLTGMAVLLLTVSLRKFRTRV